MTLLPRRNPAEAVGYRDPPPRMGFFTDTSVCIGCKACEVACKEWNAVPADALDLTGMSYDNTGGLGADNWRHVAFIEQRRPLGTQATGVSHDGMDVLALAEQGAATPPEQASMTPTSPPRTEPAGAEPAGAEPAGAEPAGAEPAGAGPVRTESPGSAESDAPGATAPDGGPPQPDGRTELRWLMASDVCKHCTEAACLDVCPTGSLFRTEFGTVVVQEDICNGCGYCIPACPYGVIDQRKDDGRAWKCTMCYDRLGAGMEPACAKACPTDSIQYGPLDELRERADARLQTLHDAGVDDARLYGRDPRDGVGGDGAFFLLLDQPESYGLPPDPTVTTRDLPGMWRRVAVAAGALAAAAVAAFATTRSSR